MLKKSLIIKTEDLNDYVTETIADSISDYLSDKYGYCVNGFSWTVTIEVDDINWDTEEN